MGISAAFASLSASLCLASLAARSCIARNWSNPSRSSPTCPRHREYLASRSTTLLMFTAAGSAPFRTIWRYRASRLCSARLVASSALRSSAATVASAPTSSSESPHLSPSSESESAEPSTSLWLELPSSSSSVCSSSPSSRGIPCAAPPHLPLPLPAVIAIAVATHFARLQQTSLRDFNLVCSAQLFTRTRLRRGGGLASPRQLTSTRR